jgi:EAL domain-containing protein (putative c-di-GMP-specific phosphodiesterase class I)
MRMSAHWFVEGYLDADNVLRRVALVRFPCVIGREESATLTLPSSQVSRQHAELSADGERLFIRDLGSTNGTFINHHKVDSGQRQVHHGDVLHIGNIELRVVEATDTQISNTNKTALHSSPLTERLPTGLRELQALLATRAVRGEFQPIVTTAGEVIGYEALGRGSHPESPIAPLQLFRIAESSGLETDLSELMRDVGLPMGITQNPRQRFFVNTHPSELRDLPRLLRSVALAREKFPITPLVLEIHEEAITDLRTLRQLKNELSAMTIQLAFDDFGAGQARLVEMADVAPDYIKFDIALIRDIDKAPSAKLQMIGALVDMTRQLGITTLAEGVSREGEAAMCRGIGFQLLQGYLFGYPAATIG